MKANTCEMPHDAQKSRMHFVSICFRVPMQSAKIPIPPFKAPWLTAPLQGRYRSSGISFLYICGAQINPNICLFCILGLATAAGCQLVASCDIAIASDKAQFATPGYVIGYNKLYLH